MNPIAKRVYVPRLKLVGVFFLTVAVIIICTKLAVWGKRVMDETKLTPVTVARLLFDSGVTLQATGGRTNIILLGIGGGSHQGADLTDTMILLSIASENRTFAFLSLPRDIWSETLQDKINSAYHYGEEKKKGGGLVLAKTIVEDVSGLPIHYAVVVDFSGFTKVIDLVGGVEVDVAQSFIDPQFPIAGRENDECGGDPTFACRYEPLHFEKGREHMDGELALKYVRSRHAEGEEGSDFARSRRQQEVLLALKEKFTSPFSWISPTRVWPLLGAIDEATDTNMKIGEVLTVGKLFTKIPGSAIKKISIEDLLYSPPIAWYGRYVLIPKEDFSSIHTYLRGQLE